MAEPRVDGDRLWRTIGELAAIGATADGGVRRIALTPEDVAGRELVLGWARAAGCEVRADRAGNVFARRPGSDSTRAPVAFGSHLDSQPNGGRFDGALGVLAGIELLRALDDAGVRTRAPLELAIWTDEEGARFEVSCIGSSVFAGALELEEANALRDRDGVAFEAALRDAGVAGPEHPGATAWDGYFELHIEQGPVLERLGVPIGVVEGITGIRWLEVLFAGVEAHAGTTPMDARADALLHAAALVADVDRIGRAHGPDGRGTVCVLDALPNAGSVIAGEARLLVDLRHHDAATLARMEDELRAAVAARSGAGVSATVRERWGQPPIEFDGACVELVAAGAAAHGHAAHRMRSGAGHDAGYVAAVAPTAMVFVPCRGGLSHNPREHAELEHVIAGAEVLLHAVGARAA